MCVLNFHDLFNLLVGMSIYCLNQFELSLKLEMEAWNHDVIKGTPAVYTGQRQIQMAPKRTGIGFFRQFTNSHSQDSPFLPNIPFLTLSYLLISNHLWVYAACQLEVNIYGTHTHTHTHKYIPLPILLPLSSRKESFKYQFKISKHFMINWRFIFAKSNYSRKSEKRGSL